MTITRRAQSLEEAEQMPSSERRALLTPKQLARLGYWDAVIATVRPPA